MKSETEILPELSFDAHLIRKDFPILQTTVHGKPLVYLDNAATSQKPQVVIDAIVNYYTTLNSNVHRGVHYLSEQATIAYEDARVKIQKFINADKLEEVIFTRGTTEGINLVAQTYGRQNMSEGDEILITGMEHHSNIVPWQMLCQEKKALLKVIPLDDNGELILDEYERMISEKTKLIAITHVSNALGTINPVRSMIDIAHFRHIPVLVDGAQAVPHMKVNVTELDADFYVFSSHKMYGPTGIGILYGKETFLKTMPPYQGGGDMIKSVTFEKTTYNDLPYKFEAGTPNIADAIGLRAAVEYLNTLDYDAIHEYETMLLDYATTRLSAVPGLQIIGNAREKAGVISFTLEGIHPHDIGTILDNEGVAIRTGHHCAQPVMHRYCIPATARASFAFYNTKEDVDTLVNAIGKVKEIFG